VRLRGVGVDLGYPVGILANNGILFSESALKGAHFIERARSAASRRPLIFLPEHHGFPWSARNTRMPACQDGAKMSDGGGDRSGADIHLIIGGSLWRRQLRHVRPSLLARFYGVAEARSS